MLGAFGNRPGAVGVAKGCRIRVSMAWRGEVEGEGERREIVRRIRRGRSKSAGRSAIGEGWSVRRWSRVRIEILTLNDSE